MCIRDRYSTGLYTWHDIVFTEIIYDVFNIQLGSTGKFGSLIQTIQFVTLSAVYTAADNFVIKCFFQPWDQCCGCLLYTSKHVGFGSDADQGSESIKHIYKQECKHDDYEIQ